MRAFIKVWPADDNLGPLTKRIRNLTADKYNAALMKMSQLPGIAEWVADQFKHLIFESELQMSMTIENCRLDDNEDEKLVFIWIDGKGHYANCFVIEITRVAFDYTESDTLTEAFGEP